MLDNGLYETKKCRVYECADCNESLSAHENVFAVFVEVLACIALVSVSEGFVVGLQSSVPEADELHEQGKENGYSKAQIQVSAVQSRKSSYKVYIPCGEADYHYAQQGAYYHSYERGVRPVIGRACEADVHKHQRYEEHSRGKAEIGNDSFHILPPCMENIKAPEQRLTVRGRSYSRYHPDLSVYAELVKL